VSTVSVSEATTISVPQHGHLVAPT
jgi:hypothetical protein